MLDTLAKKYNTENHTVVSVNVLKEDDLGALVVFSTELAVVIYRVSTHDGRVYIGQTTNYSSRKLGHIGRFKDSFKQIKVNIVF